MGNKYSVIITDRKDRFIELFFETEYDAFYFYSSVIGMLDDTYYKGDRVMPSCQKIEVFTNHLFYSELLYRCDFGYDCLEEVVYNG